jgi:hypothetical protein
MSREAPPSLAKPRVIQLAVAWDSLRLPEELSTKKLSASDSQAKRKLKASPATITVATDARRRQYPAPRPRDATRAVLRDQETLQADVATPIAKSRVRNIAARWPTLIEVVPTPRRLPRSKVVGLDLKASMPRASRQALPAMDAT